VTAEIPATRHGKRTRAVRHIIVKHQAGEIAATVIGHRPPGRSPGGKHLPWRNEWEIQPHPAA
jgi:hypothetical protein